MTRAIAVIGAAFGDEGKGLMTDYFCDKLKRESGKAPLVVRYNGGAQAGHTVVTPEGKRHVFHHFGSGTFVGSHTYLSEYFIVNPFMWAQESKELIGLNRLLYINYHAPLTTPYDMLLNRELEKMRGNNRHGSCGLGINETVTRNLATGELQGFRTVVSDFIRPAMLRARLKGIRYGYVPLRVNEIADTHGLTGEQAADLMSAVYKACNATMTDNYINAVMDMCKESSFTSGMPGGSDVVFEGAQGLALDEKHSNFPYVTRSRTGLTNVAAIVNESGIQNLEAVYVTRSYATRHGAGPFQLEDNNLRFADKTNNHNDWQGTLRFGRINIQDLEKDIFNDLMESGLGNRVNPSLAITHLDQTGGVMLLNKPMEAEPHEFTFYFLGLAKMSSVFTSYGPTRDDITGPWVSSLSPSEGVDITAPV